MENEAECKPDDGGTETIFRRFRFDPKANRWMDARAYGKKAWKFEVPIGSVPKNPKRPSKPPGLKEVKKPPAPRNKKSDGEKPNADK